MSGDKLESVLNELLREQRIPGISVAVKHSTGQIVRSSVGVTDEKTRESVRPHHRSFSGSIGKTFTAAVALKLLEEKAIGLDRGVSEFLTDEKWFGPLAKRILEGVSFRMLLNHTSGLEDYVYSRRFALDLMCRRVLRIGSLPHRPEELIRIGIQRSKKPRRKSSHKYVDTGYLILGKLIERISGESYYERLDRLFLKPLTLESVEPSNRENLKNVMTGHLTRFNRFLLPTRLVIDGNSTLKPGAEWTGGGLVGAATDFARWIWWLIAETGLGLEVSEEMKRSVETKFDNSRYGLGLQIDETPCGKSYGHHGWYPGYRSIARYYAEPNLAIGILVNKDRGVEIREIADRLVEVASK